MEEKERYELIGYCSYRDTKTGVIGDNFVELLNQQDKLIKELKGKMLILWKLKLEEYKKCNCKECMTDYEKNLNQIIDKYLNENIKLKQQLTEKEKIIQGLERSCSYQMLLDTQKENILLKMQLHSQPAEIVGKIRSKCCVEDKCKDGSFVLGINEKDLDTILKKYGGEDESK